MQPPKYRDFNKSVAFRFRAPQANQVNVVVRVAKGDKVSTSTHHLHKGLDGVWQATVELPRGRCLYRFLVDHVAVLDPASRGNIKDDHGGEWSMREVGH